ncbi:MAG: diaminopimelate epimerase [Candidatus Firestonebacteria bacterium]
MKFSKLSGAGNDFIVIDNRAGTIKTRKSFAIETCDRKRSVGADGVLFLEKASDRACSFRMRIFNSDGSEGEMCGNGIRCAGYFAFRAGISGRNMAVETLAGIKYVEIRDLRGSVKVNMGQPGDTRTDIKLKTSAKAYNACFANTGVPHAVVFDKDPDVAKLGPEIRYNKVFGKKGANANFVTVLGRNKLKVRTYERGVEGETLACGTGATASAYLSNLEGKTEFPTTVITSGGELLKIEKAANGDLYMSGGVKYICDGTIYY